MNQGVSAPRVEHKELFMTTLVVEIYEALKKAGVEEDLARSAARAVIGASGQEKLATKADLEALRLATKADLAELKSELKSDIGSVRTEIERMGRVIVMWNVGALLAVAGFVYTIIRFGGAAP
jgi:hypothetical protein